MPASLTEQNRDPAGGGASDFVPTAWTLILKAKRDDASSCLHAMDHLCRSYWYPLYAFVRRQGYNSADAQDVTQELLARLMSPAGLARLDRGKGRFRSYMLGAVKHLLAKRREKETAAKRGGGIARVSIEAADAEGRYLNEPEDLRTPESLLNYCWAHNVLTEAMKRLQAEYDRQGKVRLFSDIRAFIEDEKGALPYEEVVARHGKSLSAVKSEIRRLRIRYGQKLRDVVAETVSIDEDVDDELAELLRILGSRGNA